MTLHAARRPRASATLAALLTAALLGAGLPAATPSPAVSLAPTAKKASASADAERREPLPAAARQRLLRVDNDLVNRGQVVRMNGRVPKRRAGVIVVIQQRLEQAWKSAGRVRTGSGGTFRFTDRPSTLGRRYYRAVVPAQFDQPRRTSVSRTVWSLRWLDLTTQLRPTGSGFTPVGPQTVDGTTYPRGFALHPQLEGATLSWAIRGQCPEIEMVLANGDSAAPGSTAAISESYDGLVYPGTSLARDTKVDGGVAGLLFFTNATFDIILDNATDAESDPLVMVPRARCAF